MKKTLAYLAAGLLVASALSAQTRNPDSVVLNPNPNPRGLAIDLLEDGSFEAGSPNAFWTETSTNFGTPLCTAGLCGTGGGTAGPRTGDWWAWFGGIAAFEVASVSQMVQISANSEAVLDFYYWLGTCGADDDSLTVVVDGTEVWGDFCSVGGARGNGSDYVAASVDISAYADGGVHEIAFIGTSDGAGVTNYSLDDIALTVTPAINVLEVPTASTWGLLLLGGLLAALAVIKLRA